MAGETTITVIGNLTDDPELRFTPSGCGRGEVPRRFDAAYLRPADQRVEGRRAALPVAAPSGGRRRRTSPSRCSAAPVWSSRAG